MCKITMAEFIKNVWELWFRAQIHDGGIHWKRHTSSIPLANENGWVSGRHATSIVSCANSRRQNSWKTFWIINSTWKFTMAMLCLSVRTCPWSRSKEIVSTLCVCFCLFVNQMYFAEANPQSMQHCNEALARGNGGVKFAKSIMAVFLERH